jgi:hypothetical protein
MAHLTQPVFTAQLLSDSAGSYEFGKIDDSLFSGQLQTAAVDSSNGFWEVASTSAVVSGQTIDIAGGSAILDTGTSLMLVADEMVVGYWNNVDGAQLNQQAGGIIFPCNADLPDLQVAIGDNLATVDGANMNFANVGTDSQTGEDCKCLLKFDDIGSQMLTVVLSLLWRSSIKSRPSLLDLRRRLFQIQLCCF